MARTKLVTIESYGNLHVLGGIKGPVMSPCNIDLPIIISLLNDGKIVYEVNPNNSKEKVRLTSENVLKYNNFETKKTIKPIIIPKKEKVKISDITKTKEPATPIATKSSIINDKSSSIGIDLFISNKYS